MYKKSWLLFCITFLLYSCTEQKTSENRKDTTQIDTTLKDSISSHKPFIADSAFVSTLKGEYGYRFIIKGDFDGDGKQEILTEHFINPRSNKETYKYYEDISYDSLISITCFISPVSFVISDNPAIDSLMIGSGCQLLGIAYLRNEGDLNGDGTDEISYVPNNGDWSSTNSCRLMTYKNHKWVELYRIPMWEWQLPPVPGANTSYGLFGAQDVVYIDNDTLNQRLEKEMKQFPGFIKKIGKNKIEIYYRNFEASSDTAIIDLRAPKSTDAIDSIKYKEFFE